MASGRVDSRHIEMGVERTVVAQFAPGDAGEFVGQCACSWEPLRRRVEARAKAISDPVVGGISRTFAASVSVKSGSRGQGVEIWRGAVASASISVGIRDILRRTIGSGAGNPLHPLFLLAATPLICLEGLVRFAVAGDKNAFENKNSARSTHFL